MSNDNLSPRQFHGTNASFEPGDTILPGNEVKSSLNSQHSSLVWSTDDPKWAGAHGNNVYEVQHEGLAQKSPGIHGATVSLGAKVIRKHTTASGYAHGKVR
jgi:hypothetical protein